MLQHCIDWLMGGTLLAAALAPVGASAQSVADADKVAMLAQQAMQHTGARGLAIAVIEKGQVVSLQVFGDRNEAGDPLTTETVMYGASITKAVFGYLIMQMVDEGKIDLDRPIADILPKPIPEYGNDDENGYGNWRDLAGDERWRKITPRMTLEHATGFANFWFLEPDQTLRIHFEPGTRYSYSGEGIELLQFGLEQGLGLDTEAELQRRFFKPLGMGMTSLIWQDRFSGNLADGWQEDGSPVPHDDRSAVRAAGSMDTTLADLAKLAAYMVRGEGLSESAARERVAPGLPIRSDRQFPTLRPDAPPEEQVPGLAAGIGVVTFSGLQGPGWFKGGHNEWTANSLVCLEQGQRCALLMSNDVRAEAAFPMLIDGILGETGVPYQWEYPALYGR